MSTCLMDTIRSLREGEFKNTLVGQVGCCVDTIRQMNTDMGLRPYRVYMVKLGWTGPTRGDGVLTEVSRVEILPVPKVADMASVQLMLQPGGLDEQGNIIVSEISAKYTEFQLRGLGPGGEELDPNQEFMWEVSWARDDGTTPIRRRFHPIALPNYNPGMFQWTITLVRASTENQP